MPITCDWIEPIAIRFNSVVIRIATLMQTVDKILLQFVEENKPHQESLDAYMASFKKSNYSFKEYVSIAVAILNRVEDHYIGCGVMFEEQTPNIEESELLKHNQIIRHFVGNANLLFPLRIMMEEVLELSDLERFWGFTGNHCYNH